MPNERLSFQQKQILRLLNIYRINHDSQYYSQTRNEQNTLLHEEAIGCRAKRVYIELYDEGPISPSFSRALSNMEAKGLIKLTRKRLTMSINPFRSGPHRAGVIDRILITRKGINSLR